MALKSILPFNKFARLQGQQDGEREPRGRNWSDLPAAVSDFLACCDEIRDPASPCSLHGELRRVGAEGTRSPLSAWVGTEVRLAARWLFQRCPQKTCLSIST